jgi:hypothetical protein
MCWARRSLVPRTRSTQPCSTMRSRVTAMLGGDMSSAWPSCFWFTAPLAATSIRIENSVTRRSSASMCRANTLRNSRAAREAA